MAARKQNSTYTRNEAFITECDLTYAVNKIGGRWKILILNKLENEKQRFSDLKKEFPLITERMLTLQLRALEQDGLVKRTVYAEVPPRVEYELTEMGMAFGPIFQQLSEWGGKHRSFTKSVSESV
ncbi:winged helix-turn-helix transcriptional regulator [Chitinophaga arvensicola]|uniref:DNA-binding transcriptional regulator, HxlR family n=1 Tax=Chitinophaga arvensicola TaxID=29529 RepID=A0A1I0S9G1_9BACT|nr:helix-turn-helix domain-containing protein [Chitinophaga arvensicola]SEW52725.1 DNA-binding transcriptional regulator, HxlR family [Chitinophaga arvensicola]